MQKDSSRRRFPLADRVIEVIDDTLTGEVLLDEALKMMKSSEKMSVNSWIDLMSGTFLHRTILMPAADTVNRRDLESDEDRLPTKASPRTAVQGTRGQGHSARRRTSSCSTWRHTQSRMAAQRKRSGAEFETFLQTALSFFPVANSSPRSSSSGCSEQSQWSALLMLQTCSRTR
jgi:hypothetical protein